MYTYCILSSVASHTFIIHCIYISIYALGHFYQNESSLHGHESLKIAGVILAYAVSTASVSSSVQGYS